MFTKSSLTSASALFLILLSSLPTAYAGQASMTLYAGDNCSDTEVTEFQPSLSGDGGCGAPITVTRFQSVRLNWSSGLSAVAICAQGYSCDDGSSNLIPYTGQCVKSHGTFDKVQLCIN
ncbi:hypothetical protein BJY00DRAFT_308851 [Aspergillus carlsbadensis]|nr:hypothetical protein BJY00DRAFT_308851 [Aspergillus carlsbadensis]